jgi:BirA family biotin operon repressor/biotin-[acetyl-CoA-carboxylase] ligase
MTLGEPRHHVPECTSTNDLARKLAAEGAPHGTLVTTDHQTAGRGRQGRRWEAPPGTSVLMSLVVREPHPLLSLAAGVAVARVCGPEARIKWPNDIWLDGDRKVAGILVEGRPLEGWAVVGIGLNVALDVESLPPELRETATSLGRPPEDIEPTLSELLAELEAVLALPKEELLAAWRERDALAGRAIAWADGEGVARGIDDEGQLLVETADGSVRRLNAAEVHLLR